MRMPFGKKEPAQVSSTSSEEIMKLSMEDIMPNEFRIKPTFEEVAEYAMKNKLFGTTKKLKEAHRAVRKQRLQIALQECNLDGLTKAVLGEIIDLL